MRRMLGLAGLLLALVPGPLSGQRVEGRLGLSGGSATDERGLRASAYSFAGSLTVPASPRATLSLGGGFTRFDAGDWSLAGSGVFAGHASVVGPVGFGLTTGGAATRTSYDASILAADVIPTLELRFPRVRIFAGARGALARTSFDAPDPQGPGGIFRSPAPRPIERSGLGPAVGVSVTLATFEAGGLVAGYRGERLRVEGETVDDHVARVAVLAYPVTLSGSLGLRRSPSERSTYGGARLSVAVAGPVLVDLAAESYPTNALTGTAAGRSVSAGLSIALGGMKRPRPLPAPAGVGRPAAGLVRLSIRAPDAERVEVAGDWNNWRFLAAARAPNGVWYADLAIPPGEYRYAFRLNGRRWAVPEGAVSVDDGYGGTSALLVVRAAGRREMASRTNRED